MNPDWQSKHVKNNLVRLTEKLTLSTIMLQELIESNIFVQNDVDQINIQTASRGNHAGATLCLGLIQTRTNWYAILAKIAHMGNQGPVLSILLEGVLLKLEKELKDNGKENLLPQDWAKNMDTAKVMAMEWNDLKILFGHNPTETNWIEFVNYLQYSEEQTKEFVVKRNRQSTSAIGDGSAKHNLHHNAAGIICPCLTSKCSVGVYNPLNVVVKQPEGYHNYQMDNYNITDDKTQKLALIINIREFKNQNLNLNGAEHDFTNMRDLWSGLGFTVSGLDGYVTLENITDAIENFKAKFPKQPANQACCVVFVGSHGCRDHFLTSDMQTVNVYEHVIFKFNRNNCPNLNDRPKIFLLDMCQEFKYKVEPTKTVLPVEMNHAVVVRSTLPGTTAALNPNVGSLFTYCLTNVFMRNAWNKKFVELLQMTETELQNLDRPNSVTAGQLCTVETFGITVLDLYFKMGLTFTRS